MHDKIYIPIYYYLISKNVMEININSNVTFIKVRNLGATLKWSLIKSCTEISIERVRFSL